jgi:hypothetical protein
MKEKHDGFLSHACMAREGLVVVAACVTPLGGHTGVSHHFPGVPGKGETKANLSFYEESLEILGGIQYTGGRKIHSSFHLFLREGFLSWDLIWLTWQKTEDSRPFSSI